MRLLRTIIILTSILLLQTMVLNRYIWVQFIDLFLLMNVYYALNFGQLSCLFFSLSSGIIQDAFSQGILGMNAFSKTVVAYFISFLSARLMIKHPFVIMLLIGVSSATDFLIIRGLHLMFGLPAVTMPPKTLVAASLLNGVVGMIGFQIADRIRLKKEYA